MQPFPHHYSVTAATSGAVEVVLDSEGLPPLVTAAPLEFDGPGTLWSPEAMLVGAVANCFVLTFRALAKRSGLTWSSLSCDVSGTLDRVERVIQFTAFDIRASLRVPAGSDTAQAERLLERAEQTCLISNSLKAPSHLAAVVEVESGAGR